MTVTADDDVVVQHHAKRRGRLFDVAGHGDVGFLRGRVARRVIVQQDQRRGSEFECPFDNLARVNRRVVDRGHVAGVHV